MKPVLPSLLIQLAQERLIQCVELASVYLNQSIPCPEMQFTQRGKIAGTAHLQRNVIKLNPTLLMDNQQEFLTEVIPHELCHIIAYQLYGRVKPHGAQWKTLMAGIFDLEGRAGHQMDTRAVAGKTFDYQCQCGVIELTIRRHRQVVRNQRQYRCVRCQSVLTKLLGRD